MVFEGIIKAPEARIHLGCGPAAATHLAAAIAVTWRHTVWGGGLAKAAVQIACESNKNALKGCVRAPLRPQGA